MIPFSSVDSTICNVKNWYIIGSKAFTVTDKVATMNQNRNKTTCIAMDVNVDSNGAFKIDSFILFQVIFNNVLLRFCSDFQPSELLSTMISFFLIGR